ncbi:universal stress protein [Natrinema sp. 1APR25-10V2]|uniref:universal stress protein n=1 Tax=Natrinema sp. 1APR25-10V2 TaxID=2951081 RepID=UPI002874B6F6|nr:universal stress protein [Natrinema sp. 1APR25-10V2]MDS0477702.1 universal stress protein [Natrinema sp. 1APR25-10V2]
MYQDVLIPTDGHENTEQAIDEAIELAAEMDARLHALYVINSAALAPGITFADLETIGQQAVEYVRDRALEAGVERVEECVTHGLRGESILRYAADHDVDLIVMGRHRELDHLVRGSVSKQVSEEATAKVLVVD